MNSEIEPLERIIHQAFHELADKYNIDVDIIASIIEDYDDSVSGYLEQPDVIQISGN